MLPKNMLRAMAEAERMMDEGKIPFVFFMSPSEKWERLAVGPDIMEELGLETGQKINSVLVDAIFELSLKTIRKKLMDSLEKIEDSIIDEEMEDDFDFRKFMNEDGDETRH